MNTAHASQPLWDFALVFYAQPKAAEACLQLQDEYGANVCLLIALRWLDIREQSLSSGEFTDLQQHINVWTQEIVVPLRNLRRKLKEEIGTLRNDDIQQQLRALVKQAELLAEKKLLNEIESWIQRLPAVHSGQPCKNLQAYLVVLKASDDLIALLQEPESL